METLRRLLQQLRDYWQGQPTSRRIALVGAGVAVLLAVAALVALAPAQQYRTLYSDLPPEDAASVTTRLQELAIPYRLEGGGTTVAVPEDRLAQARVSLAADGLPARGGKGYELFDETSLGMTPFVQNVNYQRALQAELARSVMQLEPVQSARVLIARPEPTPFVRDQRPPTASVVIKLKPGATLSRATAAGIVSLVARSVDGLKPENVTIVDSSGRLLSDPNAAERENLPAGQMEYRRDLESYLAAKAEEMLARALGPGRAVVKVSADINFQKVRERRETYSPEDRAVAAERLTTTRTTGAPSRGIAGATSNISRVGGTLGGASSSGSTSSEEVIQTDYLVSKSVRELEDRMGAVERLTVAVVADLAPAGEGQTETTISLTDAQEIVKQAVGFRPGRDEIKVSNVRFAGSGAVTPEADEELARLQRFQSYVGLVRNICIAVALVLVLAMTALLLFRRRRPAPAPTAEQAAPPGDEERRRLLLDRLTEMARSDPERVAGVFGMLIGGTTR